jgi:hypothetical protein
MTIVRKLTFSTALLSSSITSNPTIKMMKGILFFSAVALCAAASSAEAQRSSRRESSSVELGIDGGVMFGLDDPKSSIVSLPVQDFRVGFLVSPTWEIEPRFNLTSIHGGGVTATSYSLALGALYQPGGDRVGKGLYVRPFLGVAGAKASGAGVSGSSNNGFGGAGVGLKLPWNDRRLATRMEANYTHGFGDGGGNAIGVLIGLSFFTR